MATTYFPDGTPSTLDTATAADFTTGIPQSDALPPALDLSLDFAKKHQQHQDEAFAKIDSALLDFDNFAPHATPAARRRAIGSAYVGHKLGITPADGLAYDRQRATIAKELFDGRGADSDDDFFHELQQDAHRRKDRTDLAQNLLTESLVAQLAQAVDSYTSERTTFVEVDGGGSTGLPGDGGGPAGFWKVETFRYPRNDDVRPFEAWQEQAKQLPGYDPKRAADYLSDWNLSRQAIADRIAPFRDELYQVFNGFRDNGFDNSAARDTYYSLPEGEHQDFLDALGLLARTLPKEEQASFWSNLKKQASRDTSSNLRSIGDGAVGIGMRSPTLGWQDFLGTGEAIARRRAGDQDIRAQYYAERNFRADVERIAAEDYDPVKTLAADDSWTQALERGAYAAPGAITYTATAAVPWIGQAAVFASLSDQAYTEQRRSLMDAGLSDAQASQYAAQLAPIIATPQALLEKIGANAVLGKLPFLNRAVTSLGNRVTNRAAAYGIRTAGVATFETGIELTQDLIPEVTRELAHALDQDLPGTDWKQTFENYGHHTLTTFVAVLPLAVIGAATNIKAEDRRRTITQASDLELTAAGIAPADIAAIREAEQQGPASTLAAVDRALAGIDPQSDTAIDATQDLAETLERQQDTTNRAREAGVLPRFTATPDGYIVTDSDNEREIGRAQTAEEAIRLASEHSTAIDLDDADQVAYLATLLEGGQAAAAQGTTFDGVTETDTTADLRPFEEQTVAQAMAESQQQEARVIEQIHAREALGSPTSESPFAQIVLGQYQPDLAKGVRRDVLRINGGASVLTVFHEKTHQSYRAALETGALTREEVISFFQTLDTVLAGKTTRDGQPLQFLPTDPSQITDTALDEAMAELMESEVLRTRKTTGKHGVPAGIVTKNLKALGRLNARATGKLADFIRAIRAYFGQVFHRAHLINRGIREGAIDRTDYEAFLDRLLGIEEALDYDQMAREAETSTYEEGWSPGDTIPDVDEPFSIGQAGATKLASDLIGRIGEDNLRLEQPQASYDDKRQLLLDFSEAVLGRDQEGTQQGNDHRGLSRLQRIRHRLAENLRVNLRVDFLGETIANPADLVEKAQALRNPAFETFYLFALDDKGKLLDVMALSSRCPCSAPIAEGKDQNWTSAIDQHKAFLKQAGARSYMILHNHPSGDPSPSRADLTFTERHAADMASEGYTFIDHVVINHRKFTSISRWGNSGAVEFLDATQTPDPFLAKDWSIGEDMTSPASVANEGRRMLASDTLAPGELIVLAADTRLKTVGAYRTTVDRLNELTIAQAIEQGEIDGSTRLMIYAEAETWLDADKIVRAIKQNAAPGLLTDIAIAQADGGLFSAVEQGIMSLGSNKYGQDLSATGGQRIQDAPSFSLAPQQVEKLKASHYISKPNAATKKLTKLYRGTHNGAANDNSETAAWGSGLYFTANQEMAAEFGDVEEIPLSVLPKNPLVFDDENTAQAWLGLEVRKRAFGMNAREFSKLYPDLALFIRDQLGFDGVQLGQGKHAMWVTFPEAQGGRVSFSLGMSGIAANLSADALSRVTDPIRRAQIMERIARNLETIQRASERLELTIGEKRLKKSLQAEARMRAALRQEELENEAYARHLSILADEDLTQLSAQPVHSELLSPTTDKNGRRRYSGRLRSKSAAAKEYPESFNPSSYDGAEGISPMLWGGTMDPDQAAQELYEGGLINEPTPDALWDALSREAQTVGAMKTALEAAKRDLREAKARATQEAQLFLDEELGKQEVNFSPREEILRALATLDGILRGLPPEIRGKVGGYAQLARLSTNEARLGFLKQRLDIADKELEKWLREQYDKEVRDILDLAKPDKTEAGKRIKGKLTADVHSLFDLIREAMNLTGPEAELEARTLDAMVEMDADGNFPNVSEEIEAFAPIAAGLYRLFGGWSKANASTREEAFHAAQKLYLDGLGEARGIAIAKREKRDRQRAGLKSATGELDNDAQKRRNKTVADTASKTGRAKQAILSTLSWEQLLQHAFGENSPEAKLLADWERRADFAKTQNLDHKFDQLEALFADLAEGKFAGEQLRAELAEPGKITWTDWKGRKQSISELEAITATLMWRQEDGKRHMQGHLNAADRPVGEWHTRQEDIDAMEAQLSPEAKAIRLHLSEQYAAEYERLNPVFRSLYGVNMPRHKNYSPLTVTSQQAAGGQTMDPLTGIGMSSVSITPGSLKNRSQTAIAEPKLTDALQVYAAHIRQMEHWMAYAEMTTEARAMLNSRTVGNAVEQKAGRETLNLLRSWVDYFAQGGARDAAAHIAFNQGLSRIINRASSMALVGRASVLAIQATQLGAAAYEMPTGAFLKRFAMLMSGTLGWKDAMASDYIKRRLSQMPAIVQQGLEGLKGGKPTRLRYAMRQVGELIGGADALFTAGTYAILLDYHRTEGRKLGLKGQQLDAYAHNAAARSTDRVAQPTRAGARSFYEITATNPAIKMVWAFASEPRQKLAITTAALSQGKHGRAARSALITWLVSGVLATLIRSIMRDIRNGDDDELFDERYWDPKRMALSSLTGPAAGLPIIGDTLESAIFKAGGEYLPDGNLLDSGGKAVSSLKNAPDYLAGEKDMADALKDLETVMAASGLVSNQAAAGTSLMHIIRDLWGFLTNWSD